MARSRPAPEPEIDERPFHNGYREGDPRPERMVALETLHPADYNPRVELKDGSRDMESLKASLRRWGLVQPFVVNKRSSPKEWSEEERRHTIVGGHQRKSAAQLLGWTEVPEEHVHWGDWSRIEEMALNVALNKIGGAWAPGKLNDVLAKIKQSPMPNIGVTGFSAAEIERMLAKPAERNKAERAEARVEGGGSRTEGSEAVTATDPEIRAGTILLVADKHMILCGDALDDAVARPFLGEWVPDICVTDPPYEMGARDIRRALVAGNCVRAALLLGQLQAYTILVQEPEEDWEFSFELCWIRTHQHGFPNDVVPQYYHSNIPLIHRRGHAMNWRRPFGAYPSVIDSLEARWKGGDLTWTRAEPGATIEALTPEQLAEANAAVAKTEYDMPFPKFFAKPAGIFRRMLDGFITSGRVYDPFMGTGAALLAAHQMGKECRGMEKEPSQLREATKRLREAGLPVQVISA